MCRCSCRDAVHVAQVIVDGLRDNVESNKAKVDSVLRNFADHTFIFVGPTHAVEALHGAVTHFRRCACDDWAQM